MSWYAIDALRPAYDKTRAFFRGPGLLKKWLKIGILVFIFSLLSGGGGGFDLGNIPSSGFSGDERSSIKELFNQFQAQLASIPAETWTVIGILVLVAIIVLFFLYIVLTQLKNMAFFSILESITQNKVSIRAYLRKFFSKSISLTILEVILDIFVIAVLLALFFSALALFLRILGLGFSILGPLASTAANLPLTLFLLSLSIVLAILLSIVQYILGQFARYWMYSTDMSAWTAFKKSIPLVRNNLAQVIVLIVVQIVLGILAGILSFIISIPFIILFILAAVVAFFLVMATGFSVPVILFLIFLAIPAILFIWFVISLILTPVGVFFFHYNLLFLHKLLEKQGTKKVPSPPAGKPAPVPSPATPASS